jgi:hypothetical protein
MCEVRGFIQFSKSVDLLGVHLFGVFLGRCQQVFSRLVRTLTRACSLVRDATALR